MLKKTIEYEDYNEDMQTDNLYFNLTKTEVLELEPLLPRLQAFQDMTTSGEQRDLTTEEIQEILAIIKILIKKSYGVRSEDGRRFMKSEELYTEFTQMAVYDTFLFSMFENPQNAINFMIGIIPKKLLEESSKTVELPTAPPVIESSEVPIWIREDREPTYVEIASMSREDLLTAYRMKSQKKI